MEEIKSRPGAEERMAAPKTEQIKTAVKEVPIKDRVASPTVEELIIQTSATSQKERNG